MRSLTLYNIHWKGYPHRHLPRTRVSSTCRASTDHQHLDAAKNTFKTPLPTSIEDERKKKRFIFRVRRRQVLSSRSSATAVRARRRASHRAKQHIQAFGWDTPNAALASQVTTESDILFTPGAESRTGTSGPIHRQIESSIIPSTDGAASSVKRALAPKKKAENLYSLMHIAEVPVYWKKQPTQKRSPFNSDRLSIHSGRRPLGEYAHVRPLDPVSSRKTYRFSHSKARRTYDLRIDPKSRVGSFNNFDFPQSGIGPQQKAISQVSPNKAATHHSGGSPEFWEAIQSFSRGGSTESIKSIVQSVQSEIYSRSPSQKKALKNYQKEIELYLQAARSLPKQSLVPSLSNTTISAYTIEELKPYHSEFQSAGLAVTSAEQTRATVVAPAPPPTPPKDEKWQTNMPLSRKSKVVLENKKEEKPRGQPSFASGSTGTIVIGFTPTHEKTYGRGKTHRKYSSTSDHTVLGFTPPHEMVRKPPKALPPDPQPSPRRSLPWLRRQDSSPEASPTKKFSAISAQIEAHRPSTPVGGWVKTFEMKQTWGPVEQNEDYEPVESPRSVDSTRASHLDREVSRNRKEEIVGNEYMRENENGSMYEAAEATTQTRDLMSLIQNQIVYIDTAIQASPDDLEVYMSSPPPQVERAPIISSRSKTFPQTSTKCKGDCAHATGEDPPPPMPTRPSKVTWKGVECGIQTDYEAVEVGHTSPSETIQKKRLPFPVVTKPDDRSRTFPMTSKSARPVRKFLTSSASKSLKKSLDQSNWHTDPRASDGDEVVAFKRNSNPPTRPPPSPPPLCSQCSGPLDATVPDSDSQSIEWEDVLEDPRISPALKTHNCTARSSTECQQCVPQKSYKSSITISPTQAYSAVEVSYCEPRLSTKSTSSAEPVAFPEEGSDRGAGEQITATPVRKPASIHKNSQKGIVRTPIEEYARQLPIADPMKRPSIPKLKLQPSAPKLFQKQRRPISTTARLEVYPEVPRAPKMIGVTIPLLSSESTIDNSLQSPSSVTDKQVFRGLHVATAAACDDDVDKWIEDITGVGVRRFLAELSAFEGLGTKTLSDVAKRAAKQRQEQVQVWETVRETRVADRKAQEEAARELESSDFIMGDQGVASKGGEPDSVAESGELEPEYYVGDQGVVLAHKSEVVEAMQHRKECNGSRAKRASCGDGLEAERC